MATSYVVLDSGILLATVQNEKLTNTAKSLIYDLGTKNIQFAAPILLRYEVVAVTRKWVTRQLATEDEAQKALDILLKFAFELHFDEALLHRAYQLATQFNRPTAYDSQYLAVAERLSCDFWTADERLYNSIHAGFSNIKWLGNFA